MLITNSVTELRMALTPWWQKKKSLGFVPTMGALHEGHASILDTARRDNECSVLSIFVNPTQFGPSEDLAKYPRTLDQDLKLAEQRGVDVVFFPGVEDIYPPEFSTYVEETQISQALEGALRPQHFRGVTTVVMKLFQLVRPDHVYFGQKDLQQCAVLNKMIVDLNLPMQFHRCPTLREADGLAMSSRNRYLTPEERENATLLYRELSALRDTLSKAQKVGDLSLATQTLAVDRARENLERSGVFREIQYLECRNVDSFRAPAAITEPRAILAAVKLGNTRLIDNVLL